MEDTLINIDNIGNIGNIDGLINIDKPLHITSHDAVGQVRRMLRARGLGRVKVGHAGTLDPLASGVLVICIGQGTRISEYVMGHTKRYRATVGFGVETTTYDREGEVTARQDASHLTAEMVAYALTRFVGAIDQIPPMYSAIKQDGRKLYDLARAGQTVERPARAVTIYQAELIRFTPDGESPQAVIDVECSAGTYIRSLAFDLGQALGVGAHLAGLIRTASGPFTLERAVTLETLEAAQDWSDWLVPPLTGLAEWPQVLLDDAGWEQIRTGRRIAQVEPVTDGSMASGVVEGRLAALLRADAGQWVPHKVFLAADSD